jgi:hypothetical protein
MKTLASLASLSLLCLSAAVVLADEKADQNKNRFQEYMEKFGPPGPEHKFLEPLVGTWNAKVKMWTDPTQAPQVSDGLLVRKSILGGRFIQEDFDGTLMDKPFQGIGTIGYDRGKKKFVTTWIDSAMTGTLVCKGDYDESTKTWTFKHQDTCPLTGKPVQVRETLRIVGPDEEQLEMYRQLGDEKEMKTMEITLTRKK